MDRDECDCTVNETELFDPVNKQIVLDKAQWVDVHPLNNVSSDGPIEFTINGSSDEFLDLNNTMLHVRAKIVNAAGGANLVDSDKVAPVNNWLHSMFSDVILTISGQQVEGGSHQYPYKAYLSNLLLHSKGAKGTQLQCSGWYKDTADKMNTADPSENNGFRKLQSITAESATVELCGPLILDFMLQNKFILQNLDIALKLIPSKAEFQTIIKTPNNEAARATAVKVKLEKAVLYVRRVKALPSVINSIEEKLNLQNAIYPIQRTEMLTYTIATGSKSHSKEALFRGQMPKLVFVGFVRNDAYNGSYTQNPFDFNHFNLAQIALYREGESIPFRPFTPDFSKNFYIREYMALMQSLEIYNKDEDVDITPYEFANGYAIFGFNLTPDLSVAGHAQTSRDGNIRLEVQFATSLAQSINVVVTGIFDGRVEITKHRNVLLDWKS